MAKNKVLIPIDEVDFTLQIVPYLFRYLDPAENEVVLLHIAEKPAASQVKLPRIPGHPAALEQAQSAIKAKFATEVLPYLQALQKAGFSVSTQVRFGSPLQEIEEFLKNQVVNLVAMTTAPAPDAISMAQQLMQQATVPVVLYHAASLN